MWFCYICTRKFSHRKSLVRHNKAFHSDGNGYTCEECNKTWKRADNYRVHLMKHSEIYWLLKELKIDLKKDSFGLLAMQKPHHLHIIKRKKHFEGRSYQIRKARILAISHKKRIYGFVIISEGTDYKTALKTKPDRFNRKFLKKQQYRYYYRIIKVLPLREPSKPIYRGNQRISYKYNRQLLKLFKKKILLKE